MKKIAKLSAKYSSDVRKILDQHKNELYPSNWALANKMDGKKIEKQVTVTYTLEKPHEWDSVEKRISLFKAPLPRYIEECYMVSSSDDAKLIAEEVLAEQVDEGGARCTKR